MKFWTKKRVQNRIKSPTYFLKKFHISLHFLSLVWNIVYFQNYLSHICKYNFQIRQKNRFAQPFQSFLRVLWIIYVFFFNLQQHISPYWLGKYSDMDTKFKSTGLRCLHRIFKKLSKNNTMMIPIKWIDSYLSHRQQILIKISQSALHRMYLTWNNAYLKAATWDIPFIHFIYRWCHFKI